MTPGEGRWRGEGEGGEREGRTERSGRRDIISFVQCDLDSG